MRRPLAGLLVAAVLGARLSACGRQDDPDISLEAATVLGADVDAITAAARAKDAAKVQEALKTLRTHVDEQQALGDLNTERASRILAAGARVALDVGVPAPKVVVSRVPAPPAPRQAPPQSDKNDQKDDKDDDKEKDEDQKDEDDD